MLSTRVSLSRWYTTEPEIMDAASSNDAGMLSAKFWCEACRKTERTDAPARITAAAKSIASMTRMLFWQPEDVMLARTLTQEAAGVPYQSASSWILRLPCTRWMFCSAALWPYCATARNKSYPAFQATPSLFAKRPYISFGQVMQSGHFSNPKSGSKPIR